LQTPRQSCHCTSHARLALRRHQSRQLETRLSPPTNCRSPARGGAGRSRAQCGCRWPAGVGEASSLIAHRLPPFPAWHDTVGPVAARTYTSVGTVQRQCLMAWALWQNDVAHGPRGRCGPGRRTDRHGCGRPVDGRAVGTTTAVRGARGPDAPRCVWGGESPRGRQAQHKEHRYGWAIVARLYLGPHLGLASMGQLQRRHPGQTCCAATKRAGNPSTGREIKRRG